MITFDSVSKVYPDGTSAVRDLSLTVEPGSVTVFVGPSGCGKTTSMRMINRMVEPTRGSITVDGADISSVNRTALRLGMGYVMQHAGLLPHRSVVDNVATVLRLKGTGRRQARDTGYQTLERVGLDSSLATKYPSQLSGGQQQRVGVARALAADPPILLMDEPFSAVDPLVRADLQQELQRLQSELRKTIVFVTHDIEEALTLGDNIAVFGPGGTLQQHDTPQALLTDPATEFVARFVGRDRGIRSLTFRPGADLPVTPVQAAQAGLVALGDGWRLRLNESGGPESWVSDDDDATPVTASLPAGGSLKAALDAVLSSPARTAPVVDASGRLTGTVSGAEVMAALAEPSSSSEGGTA